MDVDDSNSNNTMYLMYRNVYPCWPFIIGAIALNLVAIFGMVTNLGVIWTTYCTKTLHGTANVLLALCSFFELLHQHGHLLFLYVALSGQNFISLSMAIRWCTVSLFALGGITLSMTFTGLDRLLCVLFPTFPNKVKPLPYLGVIITLCVIFSLQNVMNFYELASTMPFLMVPGTIGDLMKGDASQSLAIKSLILNTITIFLYVIVGIVISKKSVSNSSTAEKTNRRTFRSIFFIILLNVCGYYFAFGVILFVLPNLTKSDPINVWIFLMFVSIVTVNVSAASNGPILYITSKEYQKAFRDEFGRIRRFFCYTNNASAAVEVNNLPTIACKITITHQLHNNKTRRGTAF
uniref:G-protein coupled receptors family 1 profile domain-containing protein n=1 Tax=Globodera rostochiensis TaxID=31243 RepID=A0A914IG16_GLORO